MNTCFTEIVETQQEGLDVPNFEFSGSSFLVTGGTSGIGYEVAKLAAFFGGRVHLMARGKDVENTRKALEELPDVSAGPHTFMPIDVSDAGAFDQMLFEHLKIYGAPDCVFHSTGANNVGLVTNLPIDAFDETFHLNVRSAFVLLRRLLPPMFERKSGSLLFNASVKGLVNHPEDPLYCASKAALVSLVKSVSLTVAASGVRINCICPGPVQTKQLDSNPQVLQRIPLGRAADVSEVANIACFLLSNYSSYITGAAIPVDGGKAAGIFPPFGGVQQ